MNNDVLLTLLSGVPSIPGLLILHCVFRTRIIDRKEIGSWKGIALVVVGLLLVAAPLGLWGGALLGAHPTGSRHVSPASVLLLAGYLDVMFFWFLWNVNSFVFAGASSSEDPWEENWGASYSPELKRRLLGSVLARLDREGKIGNLIVDIGSGADPVAKLLPATPGRRFILVDIAGSNSDTAETQSIRMDAESITRPGSLSYRKALVRAAQFVRRDPRVSLREESATAMIFSDILNYVDFRKVIGCFAEFLKPEGRIIIVNLPGRGIREKFSGNGLKRNEDLYDFLAGQGLEIESKDFPCRPQDATDESEEMIVLVAKKAGRPAYQADGECVIDDRHRKGLILNTVASALS